MSRWNLNKRQRAAFLKIALHQGTPDAPQLLMYVGGEGGTGKTLLINAISAWFKEIKQQHTIRLAAYTGTAAANIGGSTIHFLFKIGVHRRAGSNSDVTESLTDLSGLEAM